MSIDKLTLRNTLPLEKVIGPQLAKKIFVSFKPEFHFHIPNRPPPVSALNQVISVHVPILLLEYPL